MSSREVQREPNLLPKLPFLGGKTFITLYKNKESVYSRAKNDSLYS